MDRIRPKCKQIPPKQTCKKSSKMDLGKNTEKTMVENAFMASVESFPAKDMSEKMKGVAPDSKELQKVLVRSRQTQ